VSFTKWWTATYMLYFYVGNQSSLTKPSKIRFRLYKSPADCHEYSSSAFRIGFEPTTMYLRRPHLSSSHIQTSYDLMPNAREKFDITHGMSALSANVKCAPPKSTSRSMVGPPNGIVSNRLTSTGIGQSRNITLTMYLTRVVIFYLSIIDYLSIQYYMHL
jgi:hypothetical protein